MSNAISEPGHSEPKRDYDLSLPGYDKVSTDTRTASRAGSSATGIKRKPNSHKGRKRGLIVLAIPLLAVTFLYGMLRPSITTASVLHLMEQSGLETESLSSTVNAAYPFFDTAKDSSPSQVLAVAQQSAPVVQEQSPVCIVNSVANVRSGPSTTYAIVDQRSPGNTVNIASYTKSCDADGATWYKIAEGQWIADFLVDCAGALSAPQTASECLIALPTVTPVP